MPLRSSRKNTRNRVRVFENRSPYDQDMASGSFRIRFKIRTDENSSEKLIQNSKSGPIGQGGKIPAQSTQVDLAVDLGLARSTGQSTWVTRVDCQVDTVSTGVSTWPLSQVEPSPPGWPGLCLVDFLSLALSLGLGVSSWLVSPSNERLLLNQASSTV